MSDTTGFATAARPITLAWVALVVITLGSWWLAPGHSAGAAVASVPITVAVVALAFVKSRLIVRYFMEVRRAPVWLRRATDAWLVVLFAAVLGSYLL
ncbi:cytochrome C oxidase subunit IV family protein [Nocardia blacklockiae]|uniref:cytochrome C oxidase subunit IV family protein n=1 Tax=Nocardia blacklockiae TaxID=480036 RepID=UPI003F695E8F